MSANHDDRDRLISDYVRGALDEETARQLEIDMLEDQALFARIQAEDLLRQGLQSTPDPRPRPARAPYPGMWRWPGFVLGGALALAVVVLGVHTLSLHQQIGRLTAPAAGVPVITLLDERSALTVQPAPPGTGISGHALIEIDVSAHEPAWFDLEVVTGAGTHHWQQLQPDGRGYLTVYVPDAEQLETVRVLAPDGTLLRHYKHESPPM